MKIIFFGSDDFALVHFQKLIDSNQEILACITQPDKAKGRGMKMVYSDIKKCAIENNITIFQPEELNNKKFVEDIQSLDCDVFVVIAYGKFLPESVLRIPKIVCINVHASLLPRYRGAAPINWVIINGEKETGLSIIRMNLKMDAGDIIASKRIKIEEVDTSQSLREKMKTIGPEFLLQTINNISKDGKNVTALRQDTTGVTFAPKITKGLGKINWNESAEKIYNLVRGLLPWPAAYTYYNKKVLKVLDSQIADINVFNKEPGEILLVDADSFTIATKDKGLKVLKVHLESSKPMDTSSFLLGHKVLLGTKLG